jgi:hypothetical protein
MNCRTEKKMATDSNPEVDAFLDEVTALAAERALPIGAIIILSVAPEAHLVSHIMERLGIDALKNAMLELAYDPGVKYGEKDGAGK